MSDQPERAAAEIALPIGDADLIWRRVPFSWYHVREDRPQSCAFDDSEDGTPTSATLVVGAPDPAAYLRSVGAPETTGIASVHVGFIRQLGLDVVLSPDDTGRDPHHVYIVGAKTQSRTRKLAKSARWVRRPMP